MMRYIIKILFSESVDFTAQYRYEHRSFHQCAILDYIIKMSEMMRYIIANTVQ